MFLNFFPATLLWLMILVPCASFFATFMSSEIFSSQVQKQSVTIQFSTL
jgi:ABC-type multidrug transport system permease subunit